MPVTCSRCKKEKGDSEFGRHPRHSTGLQSSCKQCYAEAMAEKRKARPEYYKEISRRSRERNREKMLEATRKWRGENREYVNLRRAECGGHGVPVEAWRDAQTEEACRLVW